MPWATLTLVEATNEDSTSPILCCSVNSFFPPTFSERALTAWALGTEGWRDQNLCPWGTPGPAGRQFSGYFSFASKISKLERGSVFLLFEWWIWSQRGAVTCPKPVAKAETAAPAKLPWRLCVRHARWTPSPHGAEPHSPTLETLHRYVPGQQMAFLKLASTEHLLWARPYARCWPYARCYLFTLS